MDELTLVREFRNAVPTLTPSPLARARMLRATQEPTHQPRTSRRGRALGLIAASTTAIALVIAVQGGPAATPSLADVMNTAAQTVGKGPGSEPLPSQWIYENWVEAGNQSQTDVDAAGFWTRYDGKLVAENARDGKGVKVVEPVKDDPGHPSPESWYRIMNSLPDDAAKLLGKLRAETLIQTHGSTQAARDFDAVTQCLAQPALLPPAAHSRLFRALATIPGVQIDEHPAPDLLGRPVISITFTGSTIGNSTVASVHELLLDPHTYAFRGERVTALEDGEIGQSAGKTEHVNKGQTWFNAALKDAAVVHEPGATS
jgi:hypothetical protein